MNAPFGNKRQSGAVLILGLVVLVVLTLLGLSTMRTSISQLRMAGNTEEMTSSLQAAEAGIVGVVSQAGKSVDPFVFSGTQNTAPLAGVSPNPLSNVARVSVAVNLIRADLPCARSATGSSDDLLNCDFFEVSSIHAPGDNDSALRGGARTRLTEGVQKQVIEY